MTSQMTNQPEESARGFGFRPLTCSASWRGWSRKDKATIDIWSEQNRIQFVILINIGGVDHDIMIGRMKYQDLVLVI